MQSNCSYYLTIGRITVLMSYFSFLVEKSAANDFWGKTFLNLYGESKMTQNLSILTGCCAGATVCDLKINTSLST